MIAFKGQGQKVTKNSTFFESIQTRSCHISNCRSRRADYEYVSNLYVLSENSRVSGRESLIFIEITIRWLNMHENDIMWLDQCKAIKEIK